MKKKFTQWLTGYNLKNLSIKATLSAILFLISSIAAKSQTPIDNGSPTNYYLRTDSVKPGTYIIVRPPVSNFNAWTSDPNGTISAFGATRPSSFTADNQIFNIQTSGYSNAKPWVISGINSKLVVGAIDSIVSFISTSPSSLTATVDVLANATLNLQVANTSTITFGNLASGSTVRYQGNTTGNQTVLPANYYNLSLVAAGSAYIPLIFPTSPIGIAGTFSSRTSSIYGSSIIFNGKGGQVIPSGNYYNLTISGTKSVPDTLKGALNIAGVFSDISTGAPTLAYAQLANGSVVTSTLSYNGFKPQTVIGRTYYSMNFANGQVFPVSNFNNANKTITLYQANLDLVVGQKISANSANSTSLFLDTSTVITAISDTVITLSNAPTIKCFVNHVGHLSGIRPDTLYLSSYSLMDSSITFSSNPTSLLVGDTLNAQIITAKTIVKSISGNVVSLSTTKAFTNL